MKRENKQTNQVTFCTGDVSGEVQGEKGSPGGSQGTAPVSCVLLGNVTNGKLTESFKCFVFRASPRSF